MAERAWAKHEASLWRVDLELGEGEEVASLTELGERVGTVVGMIVVLGARVFELLEGYWKERPTGAVDVEIIAGVVVEGDGSVGNVVLVVAVLAEEPEWIVFDVLVVVVFVAVVERGRLVDRDEGTEIGRMLDREEIEMWRMIVVGL